MKEIEILNKIIKLFKQADDTYFLCYISKYSQLRKKVDLSLEDADYIKTTFIYTNTIDKYRILKTKGYNAIPNCKYTLLRLKLYSKLKKEIPNLHNYLKYINNHNWQKIPYKDYFKIHNSIRIAVLEEIIKNFKNKQDE